MAACVLCRRGLRLRHLPGLRKGFAQAQHMCVQRVDETDDQEDKKGVSQHQEGSVQEEYRLHYNPRSYYQSALSSATSRWQTDNDEDKCLSMLAPSFWQQSNRYSVSCSRHLSSSKNTLLDLAFNKSLEPETPSLSQHNRKHIPPDVKVDPRAFLKCRPGYASMTLDLTQRPHPIRWEEALQLLQKVTLLKGSMKTSDVSHFLAELGRLSPDKISLVRNDHRFVMLLRYSVEHLRLFTPLQLLEVLQSFVWLDMPSVHSVLGLYEAELSRRAKQMSLHQLLLAADLWRCIGKQVPQFLQHLYDSVRLHLGQIGFVELVHLLYIIGEGRHCPKDLIRPVEHLLMLHLQQLYPEEVGAVCLGLFKSQTSMSESAVTRIVDKAHSFVEEMSDFAMVNVLKYLRFSYLFHKAWMEAMVQEVPQRAHRMGVQGLMHVALGCSALHYRNDKILMAVAERIPSLVPHCRSKDSSKLLWAFGTLGFLPVQSPSFYPCLTESLRQRKVEFQRYPEHLLTGLLGLAFVSQFPEDLITLALSPEFVNLALKSTQLELKKDLFTLDETVALELPHWTGPRISSELRKDATDMLWKFVQSDVCQKPEVQEAESALQDLLGGEKFVSKRMILPHTRSIDLEVHLDLTGQPVPVNAESDAAVLSPENSSSECLPHQGWGRMNVGVTITEELLAQLTNNKNTTEPLAPSPTIKPPSLHRVQPDERGSLFDTGVFLTSDITEALIRPSSLAASRSDSKNLVKLAIQVVNRNHYCYQSPQLLGLHALKRRQLKLAGYRVVELSHQDWFPMLRKGRAEKLAYLHCKVYNSL
ncbi:FAST kinase domain-containing protein 5, mitochondrial [Larimichthys crocea]|uniref:FAST kinase domain-containing protein 5, mitochondrial n=1 Tax=Larimichthys crocea TaxID=215358 RepID=UPI000F5FE59F|nr:FAST kinase domain-containing protein 5, mitochondrial [Larimichthys crocea]XP_027147041.1 FAST kinase domain-containing protein 5, mitochondrial [Larimichthys crocea]